MDGCKEICQRQTEMEKARRPMFQQELEELRSQVRNATVSALTVGCVRQIARRRVALFAAAPPPPLLHPVLAD